MKLLLYCTKEKPYLYKNTTVVGIDIFTYEPFILNRNDILNGKIVAECDYEVDSIVMQKGADDKIYGNNGFMGYGVISKNHSFSWYDENKTCLSEKQLFEYLNGNNGYAIHIKNLKVFDKPKELNEFYKFVGIDKDINNYKSIEKAPQNMMYAYEYISEIGLSGTWDRMLNGCIIISIRPEWLCKILNGEKKIEVRKKVLKEMIK